MTAALLWALPLVGVALAGVGLTMTGGQLHRDDHPDGPRP